MVDLLAKDGNHVQLLGDARYVPARQLQGQKLNTRNEGISQVGGNDEQEAGLLNFGFSKTNFKEVIERLDAGPKKLKAIGHLHVFGVAALVGDGDVSEEDFGDGDMTENGC